MGLSNEERLKRLTLYAIAKYNQKNGTNLVFVENISANFLLMGYHAHWITFWARDMSSLFPESKIYQVQFLERGAIYRIPIFRVKPTDEEMMAAGARLKAPYPMNYDIDKPPIVFRRARVGEDPVPGTPFVFSRDGSDFFYDSESDEEEEDQDEMRGEMEEEL